MIRLCAIDEHNFEACSELMCTKEQCCFTNAPVWSLLQAAYSDLRNKTKLYAICSGKTVVGMIRLDFHHPDCYMFTNLLVDQRYQRRGYAAKAVRAALKIFREDGRYPFVKIKVAPENTAAIGLYEKLDFSRAGETPDFAIFTISL